MKRYTVNLLGRVKEHRYGNLVDIDDHYRKINKLEDKLSCQRIKYRELESTLYCMAEALQQLSDETKSQFVAEMFGVHPDTHKVIVQLK